MNQLFVATDGRSHSRDEVIVSLHYRLALGSVSAITKNIQRTTKNN